jgi:small ligand-binding sensory domain FIST
VGRDVPLPDAGPGTARPGRGSELLLFELENQGFQSPIEDLRNVAPGHSVAEQSLRIAELLVRLLLDRHLEAITLGLGWTIRRELSCDPRSPRGKFIAGS